jgi:PPOX class probable FMN-dependent enzyme
MFERLIETEEQLRELIPARARTRLSSNKELDHLDAHARAWIEASPFVLLATADADGHCDVSPRGGPPGWVRVLDERRLALPDAPGNRRLDSAHNVLENPRCGLIFLVPGRTETLRVNGRACLTRDPAPIRFADVLEDTLCSASRIDWRKRRRCFLQIGGPRSTACDMPLQNGDGFVASTRAGHRCCA